MTFADFNCFFPLQEKSIVNTLQFNMSLPTPYVFMRRFLKAAQSDKKVCRLCIFKQTKHTRRFVELMLFD